MNAALLLLAALATPAAANLSAAETRMQAAVAADAPAMEALLERLVRQNSGTLNLDGVRRVGEMVRTELAALGFKVRWIDMAGTGRAGHLVATHAGKGGGRGKRILLIATIHPCRCDPFLVAPGLIRGPASSHPR